ncbi:MAG: hypothetical protein MRZ79_19605 [Bacteroidia bacterium]|nr:hypothetical protein [Bacteroidia bacterium]
MKKFCLFFLIVLMNVCLAIGQDNLDDKYMNKVESLDAIMENLYGVISGEKGEERNWELFHYLFASDAKLIPSGKPKNSEVKKVRYMTPGDYEKGSGKYLVENGFFEKEIHREVDIFGSLVQVFSTYEAYHSESEEKPFMRGINSIQLLNDGKRWWIVNIYWTQESEDNPLPANYLPR